MTFCNQEITVLSTVDLSAALDMVDHEVLLSVLNSRFGVQVDALQWFRSYLCGRGFQVAVNKSRSSRVRLDYSVPQGSCAGPVLYSVYASTMQDVIQPTGNTVSGIADDQIIRNEFKAGNHIAELDSVNSLVNCLMLVNEWMNENRLRMNPDKTEFIMVDRVERCG
eukprot:GHVU01063634.1.p1 GENE.GHVU01063634.1~~GHVU01063634.1.p1  ORF type:complete len:166 (-),score=9.43 GHVU01063634.1:44-541(-)